MSVALFIKLSPPGASDIDMDEIERNIRAVIKTRLTNRHVPAYIRQDFSIGLFMFSCLLGLESPPSV